MTSDVELRKRVSSVIVFLSDAELETSNKALDFRDAPNSEFMRGRAHEAKRIRRKIHEILGEKKHE